jgi:hypothetical protein
VTSSQPARFTALPLNRARSRCDELSLLLRRESLRPSMSYYRSFASGKSLSLAVIALLVGLGCGSEDTVSPSAAAPTAVPADTLTLPADSVPLAPDTALTAPDSLLPPVDSLATDSAAMDPLITAVGTQPGIPFGQNNMRAVNMTSMYNGTQLGITAPNFLAELKAAKEKGGRFVQKMAGKRDSDIKNADGTFSLAKWKKLVDGFRGLNFSSYIQDGTLMGHFLIDEPEFARRWGGKAISQATVEEMARYSKSIWPTLPTFARGAPSWLAKATFGYKYLDAGWVQDYTFNKNVPTWIATETAAAKLKGLGMITGIHVINGGDGSSGVRGTRDGKWNMSAAEIRTHGATLLKEPRACAFFLYTWLDGGATYMARSDIKAAITELWYKARAHQRTSCVQ